MRKDSLHKELAVVRFPDFTVSASTRVICPIALAVGLLACARDEPRHVYRSAPPARENARAGVSAAAPEPPVGTNGPSARIVSVLSTSTGRPASLQRVDGDIDIVTLAARGGESSTMGPVNLELRITGSTDTTLVRRLEAPVPVIIAHVFRLPVRATPAALQDGRFQLQVRLVGPRGRAIATSVPVDLTVEIERAGDAVGP